MFGRWRRSSKQRVLQYRGGRREPRVNRIAQRKLDLSLGARHGQPCGIIGSDQQRDYWHGLGLAFAVLLDLLTRREYPYVLQNCPCDVLIGPATSAGGFSRYEHIHHG